MRSQWLLSMGVESEFYIMPAISGYRPGPAKVCELIRALRAAGFLCDPKSPTFAPGAHRAWGMSDRPDYEGFVWQVVPGAISRVGLTGSLSALESVLTEFQNSDLLVLWPNQDLRQSGLKYPLTVLPGDEGDEDEAVYYDIGIHLSAQTVYHMSEIVEPFAAIRCTCGEKVHEVDAPDNSPLYGSRLPNLCSVCLQEMNYAYMPMTMRDGFSGVQSASFGGVTYRFAVVVDCGKDWPEQEAAVAAGFLGVLEKNLGIGIRVVRDFY